jgi:hypothetical protein
MVAEECGHAQTGVLPRPQHAELCIVPCAWRTKQAAGWFRSRPSGALARARGLDRPM